jgi:hypothetical protein
MSPTSIIREQDESPMVSKAHNGNIERGYVPVEMFLGKTSMSNFDQLLKDKMWTLRLDRAYVLARPRETPKENGPLYRR